MPVTAVGSETQVNTVTAGDQTAPQVIALSDGRYDIVWKTATGWSLQLYAADGTAVGGEVAFAVDYTQGSGGLTSVPPPAYHYVLLPNDTIGVFYTVVRMLGSSVFKSDEFAEFVKPDGSVAVSPVINDGMSISISPDFAIGANAAGNIVAVAISSYRIGQDGVLSPGTVGPDFQTFSALHGYGSKSEYGVSAVGNTFILHWYMDGFGYQFATLGATGSANDITSFNVTERGSALEVLTDGSVAFATVVGNGPEASVLVRLWDHGTIIAQSYLGAGQGAIGDPHIVELADHRMLITWTSATDQASGRSTIVGQIYDGSSGPLSAPFTLTTDAHGGSAISAAALKDGHLVVTWQSADSDGSGEGIASTIVVPVAAELRDFSGSASADTWRGGVLGDHLAGGDGADLLFGAGGNDTLAGDNGDDRLDGGRGNDSILGGAGVDTATYSHDRSSYKITFSNGAFTIADQSELAGDGIDSVSGVEKFQFNGTTIYAEDLLKQLVAVDDAVTVDSRIPGSGAYHPLLPNDIDLTPGNTPRFLDVRVGDEAAGGAFTPLDGGGANTYLFGTYGMLSVDRGGVWTYTEGFGSSQQSAFAALADGQIGHDYFTYRITDASGAIDAATLDISLIGKNDAPVLQSLGGARFATVQIKENTLNVATISASDPDGQHLTYKIVGGDDAAMFKVDPESGALSFQKSPDFEAPADVNADNVYEVQVAASDGSLDTIQYIRVAVGNIADDPTAPPIPQHSPVNAIDWVDYIAPKTINVFFAENGVQITDYYQGQSNGSFIANGWTADEKAAAAKVFTQFEAVTGVHFNVVTSIAQADFVMAKNPNTTGTAIVGNDAYWDVGSNFVSYNGTSYTVDGIGVFNTDGNGNGTVGEAGDYWNVESFQPGGYAYAILSHEIGHGLGLAHPHDEGGGSEIMDGVTAPNVTGDYGLNQGIFTTMTYNDGWPFESGVDMWQPGAGHWGYGWQAGPMALDIAALQRKYGANLDHNSGDTIYDLPDTNGTGTAFTAIWDTGGIDTIRYTGSRDATISLVAATLDYSWTGGGDPSYADGVRGGFTIAAGVVIENAVGGSGDDWLVGNSAKNVLDGGTGNDTADYGWEKGALVVTLDRTQDVTVYIDGIGEDTLRSIERFGGGEAADRITGDSGDNWLFGNGGNDTLDGGAGNDFVAYSDKTLSVVITLDGVNWSTVTVGGVAEDSIRNFENALGGSGDDTLTGDAANNDLRGRDGNDVLRGGAGNDTLNGGNGIDLADYSSVAQKVVVALANGGATAKIGTTEQDTLIGIENLAGGAVGDSLTGDTTANRLIGNGGNDTLVGGDGNDTLVGGSGNDSLVGGNGTDLADFGDRTSKVSLTLSSGAGTATSGTESDKLSGIEWVAGGSAGDALSGDGGANKLWGNAGNDTLKGGNGNDTLFGGAGNDSLDGGSGNDRFVFDTALNATGNVDSIVSFVHGTDKIQLSAGIFAAVGSSLTAGEFYSAAGAVGGHDADDRIIYNKSTGWLYYDDDGLGGDAAIHFATLLNKPTTLSTSDFVIA